MDAQKPIRAQKEAQLEQAIAALPRVKLGVLPTPLEPLPRLKPSENV